MKKRYLSIFFPNWNIDTIRRKLPFELIDRCIVVAHQEKNQEVIVAACEKSLALGVRRDMPLQIADGIIPHAYVVSFAPEKNFKTLYNLAVWCTRYSPLTGLDTESIDAYKEKALNKLSPLHNGINIDITGTQRVHGGEEALIKKIDTKIQQAKFQARIAVASTLGAAWSLSRFSSKRITHSNSEENLLLTIGKLPTEALRLPIDILKKLYDVGIVTIAQLVDLPRKEILKRYGITTIKRIDQILGELPESVTSVPFPDRFTVVKEFEYPLNNHELTVQACLIAMEELVEKLKEKGKMSNHFTFFFQGEDVWGKPYRIVKSFITMSPSEDQKHLRTILFPMIEKLILPGPVYVVITSTTTTEKRVPRQKDIQNEVQTYIESNEFLNTLANSVGKENILKVAFVQEYLPEKSYRYIDARFPSFKKEFEEAHERPTMLLKTPLPIEAISLLPDSPPAAIKWQKLSLKVIKAFGPERIIHPWFEANDDAVEYRDYFKIEDETGRWLWIFRHNKEMRWYLHGMWV